MISINMHTPLLGKINVGEKNIIEKSFVGVKLSHSHNVTNKQSNKQYCTTFCNHPPTPDLTIKEKEKERERERERERE